MLRDIHRSLLPCMWSSPARLQQDRGHTLTQVWPLVPGFVCVACLNIGRGSERLWRQGVQQLGLEVGVDFLEIQWAREWCVSERLNTAED